MGEESKLGAGEGFVRKRKREESRQKCPSWYVEPWLEIHHNLVKNHHAIQDWFALVELKETERERGLTSPLFPHA